MGKVVLAILHGYNSTPLFMKGVEHEFNNWDKFDQVLNLSMYGLNWGFFPSKYSNSTPILELENGEVNLDTTIVENVLNQLKEDVMEDAESIIFLGHSMGGLVWRALYKAVIHNNPDSWLDRPSPEVKGIIQLASPNQGSKLTNMRLIEYFDKLHTSVILKTAGFSVRMLNRLASFLGLSDRFNERKYRADETTTQIKQMTPGSDFLEWLNSSPTYVDEIPHYRAIGTRNSVFFTNLAWVEDDNKPTPEMLIGDMMELPDKLSEEQLSEIQDQLDTSKFSEDYDIKELKEFLESKKDLSELDEDKPFLKQIQSLFNDTEFEPNDGLVSLSDAALPGSILIDLGNYARNISHYSIVMWFLPVESYQHVRDQVFAVIENELLN